MTTSFALAADDFAAGIYASPKQKQAPLRGSFKATARPAANANSRTGDQGDGMIGSIILDSLFSAIFPGLGYVFNGLSALDAVEYYDAARDALAPTAHERQMRARMGYHSARRTARLSRRRPVSAGRQLLALVFG